MAIGNLSGDAITSGESNVLLGYNTGSAVTTANYNVAVGRSALLYCTTSNHNVAIGRDACGGSSDGVSPLVTEGWNTIIGAGAGSMIEGLAEHNCCLGNASGGGITTGKSNVCIGGASGNTG